MASWLRDISSSLVLMLRRCMSLSKDTRFTVASLVDCACTGRGGKKKKKEKKRLKAAKCHQALWVLIGLKHKFATTITSWLVSGQYEMKQAPTAFLKSLWALSFWQLQDEEGVLFRD